jgi:hypothetical protein
LWEEKKSSGEAATTTYCLDCWGEENVGRATCHAELMKMKDHYVGVYVGIVLEFHKEKSC